MGEASTKSSGYKEYIAGLLAGVATVVVGHPFDTVKVKLQKHNTEVGGIKYKNGLHCTARILATEGVYFFKISHLYCLWAGMEPGAGKFEIRI
ncbi:hypothetical protein HRI_000953300 [Hibiscus trionum]|uniref:Uncharacterized protein n=1 Tax=Hibiscus trionum TaxID=183268 RepID=A0A9W7H8E9_HIBTR|nr:hypothetical protein HRI_000953300 [Hibiscus trionum]